MAFTWYGDETKREDGMRWEQEIPRYFARSKEAIPLGNYAHNGEPRKQHFQVRLNKERMRKAYRDGYIECWYDDWDEKANRSMSKSMLVPLDQFHLTLETEYRKLQVKPLSPDDVARPPRKKKE